MEWVLTMHCNAGLVFIVRWIEARCSQNLYRHGTGGIKKGSEYFFSAFTRSFAYHTGTVGVVLFAAVRLPAH